MSTQKILSDYFDELAVEASPDKLSIAAIAPGPSLAVAPSALKLAHKDWLQN